MSIEELGEVNVAELAEAAEVNRGIHQSLLVSIAEATEKSMGIEELPEAGEVSLTEAAEVSLAEAAEMSAPELAEAVEVSAAELVEAAKQR